ncbi:pentatricopeptide repeat-containing protein At1g32415, mitochondrial [Humulus lupulus]|uniref:pentatricopeptide repeat-containing protein At1g32415, mitochondrial n=1 Tax=Humulus lupulus TaxID=3486 RepID=UPI002B41092C|nr:pentatricopeptide repeat-containing protein At1g32415, mitochondrial [Humulus lupulus]XP_062073763.1 pentatricopeptide repeat-containing protein At1g32415, mitochondrial [Humulus lupulus]XP_062073764.1 pentatricopeptide repeat-containing protein At1g32415, mitochondrial [Humulus lupulus]
MLLFCLRLLSFTLTRNSPKFQSCNFNASLYATHVALPKSYYLKLSFDPSRLLQCLSQQRVLEARQLLDKLSDRDGKRRIVHWTSLLTKYSKAGFIDEARRLFDIMPERNIVTFNAMLSGYVQSRRLFEAFQFFEEMPERNVVSWTSMLCGLADLGRIDELWSLFHAMPEKNIVSWNAMVSGLIRNGDLKGARLVFDQMPIKNVVSWNTMIAGYAENCKMEEAKALFDEMKDRNVITWTSIISGYCRSGYVDEGYSLFQIMPERNVISWTAMIGGFAWNGFYEEALLLFVKWKRSFDLKPNEETFISLAYACAGAGWPCLGKQLHAQIIINNLDKNDYDGRLSKSLVHMYSTFGNMNFASFIFTKNLNNFTVQSCNYLINGYIQTGDLERAQNLFDKVPIRDKVSWTSMISGYFSVGEVSKACHLFWNMPDKDAVAWTTMISGHVHSELFIEATNIFSEMRVQGVLALNSTYCTLLGAMGAMAYLDPGRQFHCLVIKTQYKFDLILDNSLISMYAKCGEINAAYSIFSNMVFRDLVSWNSMIMGFSNHGLAEKSVETFKTMVVSGTLPTSVTFLGVLSACSHAGLLSRGWELFNAMNNVYAVQPGLEHYICMIDLLGRAGKVKEAYQFVLKLPFEPENTVWGALLGICGLGETNAKIARQAAKQLLELDPLNAPAHVTLCNIYAANDQHEEEKMLRKEMGLKGVRKVPGCSWIQMKGKVHVFFSGDKAQESEVDDMLLILFNIVGES